MKKIVAILLSVLLLLTLISCGTTDSSSAEPSTSEDTTSAASDSVSGSDSSSEDTETPEDTETSADTTVGYITDDVDHSNRDPYKIAYLCNNLSWAWNSAISETLENISDYFNYEYTAFSANNDTDVFLTQIETYAGLEYDGLVIGTSTSVVYRAYELCQEGGVAFVAESTGFRDEEGTIIWPSVEQDQYNNGASCARWLIDNYQNYWTDEVDPATTGFVVIDYSVVEGIHERLPGAYDVMTETYPEIVDNYYYADLSPQGVTAMSADGAYQIISPILSAHPELEKWFVITLVDDWAQGATRAVESLGMEDKVLVVSNQADAFFSEMESGYTGSVYVAACAVSSTDFAINMAANLVTILEGRATAETIWPEWQTDSDYACMKIQGTMITKDTYQEFEDTHSVDYILSTMG